MKKILLFLIVLLLPAFALAAELNTGDAVSIEKKQKNPIVLSTSAKIKSAIDGDLTVFAKDIEVSNNVQSSSYLFGENVTVSGVTDNRLVIGSAKAIITSEIKGDLIVLSGDVTLDNTAKVDGDVFVYGGNISIKGQIDGDLRAGGSKVQIEDATIGGDVTIQSEQIQLSDNSQISGKLTYLSQNEMSIKSDLVKGGISYKKIEKTNFQSTYSVIGSIVMLIVLALVLMWFARNRLDDSLEKLHKSFGSTWLAGLLVAVFAPLAMMILIVSYVGIYVFIAVLLLYLFAWLIAYAYSAIILGHYAVKLLTRNKTVKTDWAVVVFGSVLLVVIGLIPFVGGLIKFILIITGFGVFANQIKSIKSKSNAKA
jgi:cytoskeletal protein CcmA (bactofilin family)